MNLPQVRAFVRRRLPRIMFGAFLGCALIVLTASVPSFEEVRSATRSSEATLLDRDGNVIERLRLDKSQRMLKWTPLDAISPNLLRAVVASEDKRFWLHPGVDPLGVGSALLDNLHRNRPRGASTISMQLAGLLMPREVRRGWRGKLQQVRYALAIELHWSKREILEAWLNRLPFRGELVGIDAASRGLLAKGPDGLDDADAAVLAALIRAPSASRNNVARRACAGLRAMSAGASCEQVEYLAAGLPLHPYPLPGVDEAPHLARRLLRRPGEQLRTSIDGELQRFASETLRTHLAELTQRNVEDGAVIVLDNRTGEVLAYVGSSGDLSGAADVDGAAALRQPGSTLKSFLYGLAIDQRWLTSSSVLDDSPLALTTPSGLYIPQDYDKDFRGAVSVRAALGSSLNVPAVRTLTMVGVDRFLETLRKLGLSSLTRDADHYGFGLALGGAETSLLELTNAYRALANKGAWSPLRFTPAPTSGDANTPSRRQVLSPQASFIIADILSDPIARELTFGFSSALSTHTWAAVKTGTSKGMRDNWAVGFTDRYTVGVWVGNFSGAPMWDVSGVTGAAPVWRDVVEHLHATQPSRPPQTPQGVESRRVVFEPAFEAARNDWFIDGTAGTPGTRPVVHQLASARAQLIMPPDAAVIAADPDIPQPLQAILLQASGEATHCMRLDGKPAAACGQLRRMLPLPAPGRHRLELVDTKGTLLDTHFFEVRALSSLPRQERQAAQ